jgi:hypothetical protein
MNSPPGEQLVEVAFEHPMLEFFGNESAMHGI